LRDELSAIEVYRLAIEQVGDVMVGSKLDEILISHRRRARIIRETLDEYGVEATTGTGARGAFAKAVQIGADLFGDRAAVGALEESEERGLARYSSDLDGVDERVWKLVRFELLPEQRRTYDACRTIKAGLTTPS
jgi:hypothetical protein